MIRAQTVRASVTVLAALLAGFLANISGGTTIGFALRLGLVSFIAGSVVGNTAPFVERWADEVSTRRLGMIGAVLILTGLLLQSIQYWLVVLNITVR